MAITFGGLVFRPALVPTLVFALLLPLLLGLGFWQVDRAGEKQELIEAKQARGASGALDLNLANGEVTLAERFRPARVAGHFVAEQQWLLDNRMRGGRVGYHVYSRLRLKGSGRSILVNRGWVPVGETRDFLPVLPLPEGEILLSGHLDTPASVGLVLDATELAGLGDRVVVQALDLARLAREKGFELAPLALVQDAGQPGSLEYDWAPVHNIGPEKHLGYAVQWFGLAVALAIIYFGVNTKRVNEQDRQAD